MTVSPDPAVHLPPTLTQVHIHDHFWAPRQQANRDHTIPFLYGQLEKAGSVQAFDLPRYAERGVVIPKNHNVTPQMFWDSDVAKWIEAASYSLVTHPDPALDEQLDEVIRLIAGAQQPDGYLNTWFTAIEPGLRYTNERDDHELYDAGHLTEAAVAHYQATGKTSLLDVLDRYLRHLATVYGAGPGQKPGYPGHQEIELALIRLYRATGRREHLDFARYFLDQRGQAPFFFDAEARARGEDPGDFWAGTYEYMQAHEPVRDQCQVVGHAVRAMYMYAAMADLAAEDGDAELRAACERLWDDLTRHSLYLTGGLGPSAHNEGMTAPYDLPNDTAYAETCAAVGLVFWARRMAALTGEARYADTMEQALYNNVLSGISLDGQRFFYENPLQSEGQHRRWEWHACPCCPPNVSRLLASLGEYIYSASASQVTVNLYVASDLRATVAGQALTLSQQTEYPWDGAVNLTVQLDAPARFALRLRVPGWCRGATVSLNGEALDAPLDRGYFHIERDWQGDETLTLSLPMPAERVYARPQVRQDAGLVAVQRGPTVYCAEGLDQAAELARLSLPRGAELRDHFEPDLLGGVSVVEAEAQLDSDAGWSDELYRRSPPETTGARLRLIPYAVWDHRGSTPMRVWLRERLN